MTLPQIAKFAGWLFWLERDDIAHFFTSLYDNWVAMLTDSTDEWRRFVFTTEDLVSQETADDMAFKVDIINQTGGELDPTWTTTDYNNIVSAFNAFVVHWSTMMTPQHKLAKVDAYKMKYNPYVIPEPTDPKAHPPFQDSGPPDFTHRFDQIGSAAGQPQGPQIAASLTLETPLRAHWGRFYLPAPAAVTLATSGRFAQSIVTSTITAFDQVLDSLAANDFYVVVPTTRHERKDLRALSTVTAIRMDDVADIISRRRLKHKTFMSRVPAETP